MSKISQHDRNYVSYEFRIATAKNMISLGRCFAEVIRPQAMKSEKLITVGLVGPFDIGKTHFSTGLVKSFRPVTVEVLDQGAYEIETKRFGTIYHLDSLKDGDDMDIIESEEQGIAIVEHANETFMDFHYWVEIEANEDQSRKVTIDIPLAEVDFEGTQVFLNKAQRFFMA
ncbi:MAG TPA: hypothetical protein PLF01_07890 [Alphaproteobacteria bacterium]|nr:hypothetical protein [Alphaproteobacteria bacterium]